MTSDDRPARVAVRWLTAQTLVFGAMAALLGIVANAMFLGAYGSGWLPMTYIGIGVAGFLVSGAIARLAGRLDLLGTALLVLGSAAVAIGASWLIAAAGGAWVSVPLLVLFPILIQLGFVFVGGQAGRLLDIAGIKASFPRIAAGFSVGAVLGGLLGGQLVAVLGRTEDLLLATALCQGAFAGLVWATGRRYPAALRASPRPPETAAKPNPEASSGTSLRRLLGSRFVVLIVAYQVLSAIGSQLADFLVYDRASAQFADPGALAGYLAAYTAAMNVVSIAFLFLLAGPLLRRFGLRMGIAANPAVLTVFAVAMLAVLGVAGGASFALLATVSAGRIADIALTDGTTRTSINALYQVLPQRTRLSVQTAVEGMGVPVAIGLSGVLILVLNALPAALLATIVVTTIVCLVWTWSGVLLYREYGPALVRALERRRLLVPPSEIALAPADEAIARGLLAGRDPRSTRLGLELLAMAPPATADLGVLAGDPRPAVRMAALGGLAATGDPDARRRLAGDVIAGAGSPDAAVRLRAAGYVGVLDPRDRAAAASLLADPDRAVRSAALDSVQGGDVFAVGPAIAALDVPATQGAAAGALERLGDAVLPALATALDEAGNPAPAAVSRLVRSAASGSPARDELLLRHVGHRDGDLGLVILERLVADAPAPDVAADALERMLADDIGHGAAILGAMAALDADRDPRPSDEPVRRALADALELVRARVRAGLLARHGSARLDAAMVALEGGGTDAPIALEALEVVVGAAATRDVAPLLEPSLSVGDRLGRLSTDPGAPDDAAGRLRDLVEDPSDRWRSGWLRACAIHAAAGRGMLGALDLSGARALGDPIVDEELRAAGA
ncbi:MAG TPA: Npt1/Npt2 family nucleotide transporter [Candidatus Limnocylindrales bacterium]|nr:Npt1/Npt2 family nucleotide transporter [Candidatus Limnocylindrales bacterium]